MEIGDSELPLPCAHTFLFLISRRAAEFMGNAMTLDVGKHLLLTASAGCIQVLACL